MESNATIPTVAFKPNIKEVTRRLTAAFENLKLITDIYGIFPDEKYVFKQNTYNEFVCSVCEEHYRKIYTKKGISKTFCARIKGDFLISIINALKESKTSERMKLLAEELKRLPNSIK